MTTETVDTAETAETADAAGAAALAASALLAILSAADAQVVVVLDDHHRITHTSSGITSLLGWRTQEVVGWPFGRLLVDRTASAVATQEAQAAPALVGRAHLLTRDGLVKGVRLSSAPLLDGCGRVTGWAVVATDTSLLAAVGQRLADSEEQFRLSFEKAPTAMAVVCLADGSRGRLREANAALEAFTGRSRAQLLGLSMSDLLHPDETGDHLLHLELAATTGRTEPDGVRRRFLHADGSTRWGRKTTGLMTPSSSADAWLLVHVQDVTGEHLTAPGDAR